MFAVSGGAGIGIVSYPSNSDGARQLREQLYALRRKRRRLEIGGTTYSLRVEVFDSFGEDAFRFTMTRS